MDPRLGSALASAGLSSDEVRLLAAYLYDRESQRDIADRQGVSQPRVCKLIRVAVGKLAAVGIAVQLPAPRCSRPACQRIDGRRLRRRTVDPVKLQTFVLERPAGGGIVVARRSAAPRHEDAAAD